MADIKFKFKWYYKDSKESNALGKEIIGKNGQQIVTPNPYFVIPKGLIGKYVYCTLVIDEEVGYSNVAENFDAVGEIKPVEVTPSYNERDLYPSSTNGDVIKIGTRLTAKTKSVFTLVENPSKIDESEDSAGELISGASIASITYSWARGRMVDGTFVVDVDNISTSDIYDVTSDDVDFYIQLTYTIHLEDGVNYVLKANTDQISVVSRNANDEPIKVERVGLTIKSEPTLTLNGETINEDSKVSYGDTLVANNPIVEPSDDAVYVYQWVKVDDEGKVIPLTEPSRDVDANKYTIGDEYTVDGNTVTSQSGDKIKCIVTVSGVSGYNETPTETITTKPISAVNVRANDISVQSSNGIKVGETVSIKAKDNTFVVYEPSNGAETNYTVTYEWGIVEGEGDNVVYRPIANANGENFTIEGSHSTETLYCKVIISGIEDPTNFNLTNSETITTFAVTSGELTGSVTIIGDNLIGEILTARVENLVSGSTIKATWYSSESNATIDSISNFTKLKESESINVVGNTDNSLTYTVEPSVVGKNIWVVIDVQCIGYDYNGSTVLQIHDNTDAETNKHPNVPSISITPVLEVIEKPDYDTYIINDTFKVSASLTYVDNNPSSITSIVSQEFTWFISPIEDTNIHSIYSQESNREIITTSTEDNSFTVNEERIVGKYLYCRVSNIKLSNETGFELTSDVAYVKVGYISLATFKIENLNITGDTHYGQKLTATCIIKDARGNVVQRIE